ncbi:hypothetical protein PMI41_01905 [Phyllobacterium sp. YR531]|nr:hypothetical protein PMI41_01905 [Phyllobacterium sp. YR531]
MNDNQPDSISLRDLLLGIVLAILCIAWIAAPWIFGERF